MSGILKSFLGTLAVASAVILAPLSADAEPLVNAAWVELYEDHSDLVLLDVRSDDAFRAGHVAGSVQTSYPGKWRRLDGARGIVLPSAREFGRLVDSLGITAQSYVAIIADTNAPGGAAKAAEVYYTFRYFGHRKVSIVDGGIRALKANGNLSFATGRSRANRTAGYVAQRNRLLLATFDQVYTAMGRTQMVDARRTDQFLGLRKASYVERGGSIPGSRNLPFDWLVADDGTFLDGASMAALLNSVGLVEDSRLIVFGNSSREAALVWFAAYELAGFRKTQLYVGAMAEWAAKDFAPMERRIDLSKKDAGTPAIGNLSSLLLAATPSA